MGTTIDIGTAAYTQGYINAEPTFLYTGISINPTESMSVVNPSFVINYDSKYLTCNYCKCDDFGRYYRIVDKIVDIGKKITLICKSDPLTTFCTNASCSHLSGIVLRKSQVTFTNFPDAEVPLDPARKEYLHIEFNKAPDFPFDNVTNNYVLETLKSEQNPIPLITP